MRRGRTLGNRVVGSTKLTRVAPNDARSGCPALFGSRGCAVRGASLVPRDRAVVVPSRGNFAGPRPSDVSAVGEAYDIDANFIAGEGHALC